MLGHERQVISSLNVVSVESIRFAKKPLRPIADDRSSHAPTRDDDGPRPVSPLDHP
jgi:hypothetical protein